MKSTNSYDFQLTPKRCSTCEDLRRLKARIEAALRNVRNLYRAAVMAIDSAALQNLEEELEQITAARKFVCCAINAHLTCQHSQTPCVRIAA